jgi:hypothetical protein
LEAIRDGPENLFHDLWDTYVLLKHWSEVAILCLMLYILQSRFTAAAAAASEGYDPVPDAEPKESTTVPQAIVV